MAISIRATKIDRLGKLAEVLSALKAAAKEYEELRKEIAGWYADKPAEQSFTESGKAYVVEVSPCGEVRQVNIAKLAKRLGPKRFLQVVQVPMKLLDAHVSPEDQRDMVTTTRTGARRVTVSKKPEATP